MGNKSQRERSGLLQSLIWPRGWGRVGVRGEGGVWGGTVGNKSLERKGNKLKRRKKVMPRYLWCNIKV